jgi:hypothetical protein
MAPGSVSRVALQRPAVDQAGKPRSAVVHQQKVAPVEQRREERAVQAGAADRAVARAAFRADDYSGRPAPGVAVG